MFYYNRCEEIPVISTLCFGAHLCFIFIMYDEDCNSDTYMKPTTQYTGNVKWGGGNKTHFV